ncbi:hypothetical protein B7P43_G04284 [Cryptotermes secundus]|uniref:Scavenger receptor class B member 1 n=2 Tax=Cryptotermes secundus TaxID=105785 RepID=A0A2J7QFY3_9NEOP|nr:hypothetical protein B7P43_G04284 [Cryptotermes secundus]
MGIILSSIPWLDYIILKNLRLVNGSLSYHYWQRPGVIRLTKVYIYNVTNPDGFLNNGEKPKLTEIGPFVYREDMEKVNIKFHDNGTVTFQHNKILQFVPELSLDKNSRVIVPNIPLLTLTTQSNSLPRLVRMTLSIMLRAMGLEPFVNVTAEEFIFGYDDTLVSLAHKFFPKHRRPLSRMGLLLGRNGTLNEVSTIYTGHTAMEEFGYMDKLNGLDHLPYWPDSPCNNIRASEGSFFPPRKYTHSDVVHVYDKDLCRIIPLHFRGMTTKNGIEAGIYTPPEDIFDLPERQPDNKCYCGENDKTCPAKGLQNIAPCQFGAPAYLSFPHFYQADPALLEAVEGLKPEKEKHQTYFLIQPNLGVPVEGQVRVQFNLKVERSPNIYSVAKFPDIVFPIIWLQEGITELTPSIRHWVYLATTVAEVSAPIFEYGSIVSGILILVGVFIKTYKNVVFTKEALEKGKETLRRGSSFIINGQHRLLIIRDSYSLLNNVNTDPDPDPDDEDDGV